MKHSNFKVGDAVIRRWNNQVYYICHDIDSDKWEFMIDKTKYQTYIVTGKQIGRAHV